MRDEFLAYLGGDHHLALFLHLSSAGKWARNLAGTACTLVLPAFCVQTRLAFNLGYKPGGIGSFRPSNPLHYPPQNKTASRRNRKC